MRNIAVSSYQCELVNVVIDVAMREFPVLFLVVVD